MSTISNSSPALFPKDPGVGTLESTSRWMVMFGPTETADGAFILNPYDLDDFAVASGGVDGSGDPFPLKANEIHQGGGRIFTAFDQGPNLELLPLFTEDNASATIQMWGFDWYSRRKNQESAGNERTENDIAPSRSSADTGLGLPYPVIRDDDGNPQTLTFTATDGSDCMSIQVVNVCEPIPDNEGPVYVMSPRHIFERRGMAAFFAHVTNISAGQFMLLARTF